MTTPADYRGFAIDCFRWAEQASDASQRENLIDIARLWKNVAIKMDQHVTLADDVPALLRRLRAKLTSRLTTYFARRTGAAGNHGNSSPLAVHENAVFDSVLYNCGHRTDLWLVRWCMVACYSRFSGSTAHKSAGTRPPRIAESIERRMAREPERPRENAPAKPPAMQEASVSLAVQTAPQFKAREVIRVRQERQQQKQPRRDQRKEKPPINSGRIEAHSGRAAVTTARTDFPY